MKSVLISLLLLANIAFANTEIVKVEVEGFGDSLQSAIDRGLSEAMGRVNGRSIESEVVSKNSETLNVKNQTEEMQNNPDSVKMVRAGDQALWFGRGMTGYGDWHLGIYGYKRDALELYADMLVEKEEQVEKLEQLRWLKNGWQVGVLSVQYNGMEINTPEDLEEWHSKNSQ